MRSFTLRRSSEARPGMRMSETSTCGCRTASACSTSYGRERLGTDALARERLLRAPSGSSGRRRRSTRPVRVAAAAARSRVHRERSSAHGELAARVERQQDRRRPGGSSIRSSRCAARRLCATVEAEAAAAPRPDTSGKKICRGSAPSGMPGPSSSTSDRDTASRWNFCRASRSARPRRDHDPRSGVGPASACAALRAMLSTARVSCSLSASIRDAMSKSRRDRDLRGTRPAPRPSRARAPRAFERRYGGPRCGVSSRLTSDCRRSASPMITCVYSRAACGELGSSSSAAPRMPPSGFLISCARHADELAVRLLLLVQALRAPSSTAGRWRNSTSTASSVPVDRRGGAQVSAGLSPRGAEASPARCRRAARAPPSRPPPRAPGTNAEEVPAPGDFLRQLEQVSRPPGSPLTRSSPPSISTAVASSRARKARRREPPAKMGRESGSRHDAPGTAKAIAAGVPPTRCASRRPPRVGDGRDLRARMPAP